MQFQVQVKEFKRYLNPVIRAAQANSSTNERGYIWVKADHHSLSLYADSGPYDVCTEVSQEKALTSLKYKCDETGCFCCKGRDYLNSLASYPPNEIVRISLPPFSLTISPESNPEDIQELPVQVPPFPNQENVRKSEAPIRIGKQMLLKGIDSVKYAIGAEKYRPQFQVVVIDLLERSVRFTAGNGAFFAVKEYTAKKKAYAKSGRRIIVPAVAVNSILSAVSHSSVNTVYISHNSNSLVFKAGETVIRMKEYQPKEYPNIDNVLGYEHPYKVTSLLENWLYPIKGMRATFDSEAYQGHNILITVDPSKGQFRLEANYQSKAQATIPFSMNTKLFSNEGIQLSCNSLFLAYMITQFGSAGEIEFRYISQDKPIMIKSQIRHDKQLGYSSQDICFFTTSNIHNMK